MKRSNKIFLITLSFLLYFSANCKSQIISFKGKVLQTETLNPIVCRININDKFEYFTDTSGTFNLSLNVRKINKIEFSAMGYYGLKIKNIPIDSFLEFDTIALSMINIEDNYFFSIKKNVKKDKNADSKRKREQRLEMIKQSSYSYVAYNKKKYNAKNGIIKMNPFLYTFTHF